MIKKITNKRLSFLIIFNFLIINCGYPITALMPEFFRFSDTQIFTIPYRVICVISSLLVIFLCLKLNFYRILNRYHKLIFVFCFFYFVRMFYDLNFSQYANNLIYQFSNKAVFFLFFIGICVIPMISSLSILLVNIEMVGKWYFALSVFAAFLAMKSNNIDFGDTVEGRLSASMALDSIRYGHLGATCLLLGVFLINKWGSKFTSIFGFTGILLGLYTMAIANSRSPFLAGIVVSLIYLFKSKSLNAKVSRFLKFFAAFLLIMFVFGSSQILDILGYINPSTKIRIMSTFDQSNEMKYSGRDIIYMNGIEDFLDSPVIGKHFVLTHGIAAGYYVHNVIIESFMALGVFGGITMVFLIFNAIKLSFKNLKTNSTFSWIGLLFFQSLVFSLFSGSMYTQQFFWVFLFLIFTLKDFEKYRMSPV